jgi:uncharacterized membrane protein YjjP (DUF1212 family)
MNFIKLLLKINIQHIVSGFIAALFATYFLKNSYTIPISTLILSFTMAIREYRANSVKSEFELIPDDKLIELAKESEQSREKFAILKKGYISGFLMGLFWGRLFSSIVLIFILSLFFRIFLI